MPEPTATELEKIRELGRLAAPWVLYWATITLAAGRLTEHTPDAGRQTILDESHRDALRLLQRVFP